MWMQSSLYCRPTYCCWKIFNKIINFKTSDVIKKSASPIYFYFYSYHKFPWWENIRLTYSEECKLWPKPLFKSHNPSTFCQYFVISVSNITIFKIIWLKSVITMDGELINRDVNNNLTPDVRKYISAGWLNVLNKIKTEIASSHQRRIRRSKFLPTPNFAFLGTFPRRNKVCFDHWVLKKIQSPVSPMLIGNRLLTFMRL